MRRPTLLGTLSAFPVFVGLTLGKVRTVVDHYEGKMADAVGSRNIWDSLDRLQSNSGESPKSDESRSR